MIPLEESIAVLLCAGLSRRFGPGNKLLAPLRGKPLVLHAAVLCAGLPIAGRVAVVAPDEPALDAPLVGCGFDLVVNPRPESGKDGSLRLGLAAALASGARGILVLLGDMPHVERAHLLALSAAATDERAAISSDGKIVSPPTFFPASIAQQALDHPDGAVREHLGDAVRIAAPAAMLADYDLPEQFPSLESG
jgi:molybdenum cofactor cytidylyltransferase